MSRILTGGIQAIADDIVSLRPSEGVEQYGLEDGV